jgi:hypothetical protein
MKTISTVASSRIAGLSQLILVLFAGVALAFLGANNSPLLLVAAMLGVLFFALFLQRPDLGLLVVLFARASSDALLMVITSGASTTIGGLRGLLLNPNTALILILIGAGGVIIFARRLPMLSLPGGVLLALLVITGLVGIGRSPNLLYSFEEWVPMLAAPVTYALAAGMFAPASRAMLRVPTVLAASFLLPAAMGYWQLLTGSGRLITGFVRIFGTFVHPNPFGLYLVVILAVFVPLAFFRSRMGVISRIIVIAAAPLLVGTYARFAWVGSVVVLLCIGVMRHRVLLLIVPLVALLALAPTVQMRLEDPLGGSFAHRVGLWGDITRQWLSEATQTGTAAASIASILGGLGPGASALMGGEYRSRALLPHNDYLRLLVDHGVVGVLSYILVSATMIRLGYQAYRTSRNRLSEAISLGFLALAIAYPIMSITSNIVAATHNQIYFWTLAGLCASLRTTAGEHRAMLADGRPSTRDKGWNDEDD